MVETSHPKYTYLKRGVYYFCNAVPVDLIHYYTKDRVVQSLMTKSRTKAHHASVTLAIRLEDYWLNLRLKKADVRAASQEACRKFDLNLVQVQCQSGSVHLDFAPSPFYDSYEVVAKPQRNSNISDSSS